jgi:uncharacterized membrane protein HdeD (DUF308 family)
MTNQVLPWRDTTQWWVLLVEGAIALLIGLYIILQPQQAGATLVQIIGGYLLITSLLAVYRLVAKKGDEPPSAPGRWIRVGIGLLAGLVAFAHPWIGTIDAAAAATVLAIGLLILGVMGIYAIIRTHAIAGWRWSHMIEYGLYLLLGGLIVYNNISENEPWILPTIGWITLIGGAALIGYGIWVYRKISAMEAAASTVPAAATVTDSAAALPAQSTTSSMTTTSPSSQAPQTMAGKSSTVAVNGNDDKAVVDQELS